jgi:hypothetical protein
LEKEESEPVNFSGAQVQAPALPAQLEVITATTAEEREFSELRRELPLATSPKSRCGSLIPPPAAGNASRESYPFRA